MPKHVAVILDGNRRWAEKRGLGTSDGHEAGARKLVENAKDCFAMGTNTISLFAFSTENWARPEVIMKNLKYYNFSITFQDFFSYFNHFDFFFFFSHQDEVNFLMALFEKHLKAELPYFRRYPSCCFDHFLKH